MLRVLVVALGVRTGGGGGSHVLSQVTALSERPELELTVHASGRLAGELARMAPRARVVGHPRRAPAARLVYEQLVLARRARRYDVLYVPGNLGLLLARTPQVVCEQNAWYFTAPVRAFRRRACSRRMRMRLVVEAALARASVRRARAVIAVSETMRAMLEADMGRLAHVRVIVSAAPMLERSAAPPPAEPYVLAVAPDDPHKDLDGLVEAFARNPDLPPLVIVGRCAGGRRAALQRRAPGRVSLLGLIDDRRLIADLYAGAACLVAHSYLESFGMTPAEALLCGTPVAASDIPAHREVCGDRACYYDPADVEALAAAVRAACAAPRPAIQAGGARSWADNAAELADELRSAAAPHRTRSTPLTR
ncbi:MAG: hypothetical protein QOJ89_4755 [bacterium]